MADPLRHARAARSPLSLALLATAVPLWFALGMIGAHWIVLALFAAPPTLLAWEVLKNDTDRFTLADGEMSFATGADETRIPLARIGKVRLNRRLDLSWRVTICLKDGRKLRLPPSCQPPIPPLQAALRARGIRIEQVQFSFAG